LPLTGGNVCFVPQSGSYYRYLKPTDPGAGNPLTWTHSSYDEALLLITLYCRLALAVTGTNRYFRMRAFSSSGRTVWMHKCALAQLDMENRRYLWDRHNENKNTFRGSFLISGPVPYLWLLPGSSITLDVENQGGTDSLYQCLLQVKSYRVKT